MKTKLIFLLSFLAWMISFSSCKEEDFDTMPPETRSGKNTFGCMINGELFVGGYSASLFDPVVLGASYQTAYDKLYVTAKGKIGRIYMEIDTPQENATKGFSSANYSPYDYPSHQISSSESEVCIWFDATDDGICIITRFDTVKKIVSGRFEFIGKCTFSNDSTLFKQITQGRFDLKLDIINE